MIKLRWWWWWLLLLLLLLYIIVSVISCYYHYHDDVVVAVAVVMVVVVVMMIAIVVMTIVRVLGDGHHSKCDNHNDKNPQDGCVMTMNLQWEWLHVTPQKKPETQETHKKGELFDSPNSVVSVKQNRSIIYHLIGSIWKIPWILSSEGAIGPSFHCFFWSASLSQRHQPLLAIQRLIVPKNVGEFTTERLKNQWQPGRFSWSLG